MNNVLPAASPARNLTAPRAAYTVVELLLVVGVVLTLALILFPFAKGIRQRAGSAGCLSNLRQIGAASANYQADNNGYLPPIHLHYESQSGAGIVKRWWTELNHYLRFKPVDTRQRDRLRALVPKGAEKVYLCPSNPRIAQLPGADAYVNYTGFIRASGHTFVPHSAFREFRKKVTAFKSPASQVPYLIDGYISPAYSSNYKGRPDHVNVYVGIEDAIRDVNLNNPSDGPNAPVHGANINLLFIDGHAESLHYQEFARRSYSYETY